ncbi:DUF1311 domain-containing protein, partial [Cronobacter sakazakii]
MGYKLIFFLPFLLLPTTCVAASSII